MKIALICSSLEAGRDGVGDYTLRLAQACARLGHPATVVALHDRHLVGSSRGEVDGVPTLRLGSDLAWPVRTAIARRWVAETGADWVSLQYVGYGFQQKGLAAGLAARVREIADGRPLHVMFHELWIGGHAAAPLRERLVGRLQRYLVQQMIRALRPRNIHTNLAVHVDLLAAAGIVAELLPLFGNIAPAASDEGRTEIDARLPRDGAWLGGFFGAYYPEWQPEPVLAALLQAAQQRGVRVRLAAAGRLGAMGEQRWSALQLAYGSASDFVTLGTLSASAVSHFLQRLDFGLPTAPWHLLGKSSAAASMLDHGVPLIVTADPSRGFLGGPPRPDDATLIQRADESLSAAFAAGLSRGLVRDGASATAQHLIDLLAARP